MDPECKVQDLEPLAINRGRTRTSSHSASLNASKAAAESIRLTLLSCKVVGKAKTGCEYGFSAFRSLTYRRRSAEPSKRSVSGAYRAPSGGLRSFGRHTADVLGEGSRVFAFRRQARSNTRRSLCSAILGVRRLCSQRRTTIRVHCTEFDPLSYLVCDFACDLLLPEFSVVLGRAIALRQPCQKQPSRNTAFDSGMPIGSSRQTLGSAAILSAELPDLWTMLSSVNDFPYS